MVFYKLSGAEITYKKLVEFRVCMVTGYSGGANLPLLDQFSGGGDGNQAGKIYEPLAETLSAGPYGRFVSSEGKIPFITNSNEQNSGHMAQGFAKRSGIVGVTLTTSGPGVTNIITPLQDALSDGVPMIAMAGQVPTNAPPDAFQECDAIALTKACTKWNYKITDATDIRH